MKAILRKHNPAAASRPGDVFVTNDPLLRRRYPSQRHRARHAGVRRRRRSSPGPPTSPTGTTSAAWSPARCRRTPTRFSRRGCGCRRSRSIDAGEPNRPVHRDHEGQFAACPTFSRATCGRGSPRCGSASGGCGELVRKYGRETFQSAMARSWTTASRSRCRRSRSCPRAASRLDGGAGRRRSSTRSRIEITDKDVHRRSARQSGAGSAARTTPAATACIIAAQMVFKNVTDPGRPPTAARSGRCRLHHPAGDDLRRLEPAAFGFYYEVEIRLYDLMLALPRAAYAGAASRGQLRLDLRHGHRRHRIRTPAGTSRSSSRSSAAGGRRRGATATAPSSPASTARPTTAPPRWPRRATGSASTVCSLNAEPGGEGRWRGGKRDRCRISRPRRRQLHDGRLYPVADSALGPGGRRGRYDKLRRSRAIDRRSANAIRSPPA